MLNTTAVIVSYNRADLLRRAYESIRRFYPDLPVIIVDGSDLRSPCRDYVATISNEHTRVVQASRNIGHGRGMDLAISMVETRYVLLMDSDAEILSPCLENMVMMMNDQRFGVGPVVTVNVDGTNVGSDYPGAIPYLHPYFALISRDIYQKVPGFVHHGAPCIRTMIYLNTFKKYDLFDFPLAKYVFHEGRGTRVLNPEGFLKGWQ